MGRKISDFFINKKWRELWAEAPSVADASEVVPPVIRMHRTSVIPVFVGLKLLNKDDDDGDVVRSALCVGMID